MQGAQEATSERDGPADLKYTDSGHDMWLGNSGPSPVLLGGDTKGPIAIFTMRQVSLDHRYLSIRRRLRTSYREQLCRQRKEKLNGRNPKGE